MALDEDTAWQLGFEAAEKEINRLTMERETWTAAYKAACEIGDVRGKECERLRAELEYAYRCVENGFVSGSFDFSALRTRASNWLADREARVNEQNAPGKWWHCNKCHISHDAEVPWMADADGLRYCYEQIKLGERLSEEEAARQLGKIAEETLEELKRR